MGDNVSKILPLLVGDINLQEEFSKIYVNCNPEDNDSSTASSGRSNLKIKDMEILFPDAAKDKEKIPLIGGSIVKISLQSDKKINTTKATYSKKLNKYRLGRLKAHISAITPGVDTSSEFPRVASLVTARNKINKSLESMPSITDGWHEGNVPSIVLTRMISESIEDASDLQKKLDPLAEDNIRLSGLKTVGTFKFIPMQVLKDMLDILVNAADEEFGLKNYVGISGETFETLSQYLTGVGAETDGVIDIEDDSIVKILLDIFPIFHIEEDYILGDLFKSDIGYYTANDDSVYIKMPDLSGRDSSGYTTNMYDLGEPSEEYITFCFEFLNGNNYAAEAFEYQAPPACELMAGDTTYPEYGDKGYIAISREGLYDTNRDSDKASASYEFFLSPIITPKKPPRVRGFRESWEAVEMFTAPVLTKGYLDSSASPVVSVDDISKEDFQAVYKVLLDYINSGDVSAFNKEMLTAYSQSAKDSLEQQYFFINAFNRYRFQDLGFPLSVPLAKVGANRTSDVLGEANRPDILLGFRDGMPADETNDEKFFESKTIGARDIVASNRPNILTSVEDQIPPIWIPLTKTKSEDAPDDEWVLEIPYTSSGSSSGAASGLDIYSESEKTEYALYVVDDIGQIVRVPGNNIEVYPKAVTLTKIKPNGFVDDKLVFSADASFYGTKALTFTGKGLTDVVSVNFYTDPLMQNLIGSFQDGDSVGDYSVIFANQSSTSLTVRSEALVSDILGSNVGTLYVCLQLSSGTCSQPQTEEGATDPSPGFQIYVAAPGTDKIELPDITPTPTPIPDRDGFFVPKFRSETNAVHSIPLLMDGQNAEIKIKSKKPIFGGTFYAYIAILNDTGGKNLDILEEDIGWTGSGGTISEIEMATVASPNGASFHVPMKFGYEIGSSDFEYISKRKAILNFPGSAAASLNYSRFTELVGSEKEYPAYILITNEPLNEPGGPQALSSSDQSYGIIPLGAKDSKPGSELRPFITPPHILGFVATLPSALGGKPRIESNIPLDILNSDSNTLNKKIKNNNLSELTQGGHSSGISPFSIITSDGLDRLSVVFTGPKQARMSKMYKGYIGSKRLKPSRAGRIKYAENSYLVANYRNIRNIKDEGWTDVVISKKDRYFNVTYDSTLYNRTTVTFSNERYGGISDDVVDSSPVKDDGDITVLARGQDRPTTMLSGTLSRFTDSSGEESMSSIIFPGGNAGLTPLPLIANESYPLRPGGEEVGTKPSTNENAYYEFANPIKIYPSVDMVFGAEDGGDIYGMSLSDSPVNEEGKPGVEIIAIDTNGQTTVALSLSEMAAMYERIKEEAAATLEGMKAQLDAAKETMDEAGDAFEELQLDYDTAAAEYAAKEEAAQESLGDEALSAAEAEEQALEEARAAADAAGGLDSSSIGDDITNALDTAQGAVDDVMDGAQSVLDAIASGVAALNTLSDQLSSAGQMLNQIAEGVEQRASSMGPRPNDFTKVNINQVFIDKDAAIQSSGIDKFENEFKLVLSFRFEQVAAIKFNVPEIVEARINDPNEKLPYKSYGKKIFSTMIVNSDDNIYLRTIGTKKDTKFEVAGKRVKAKKGTPFTDGIYMNWIITIPDMSSFAVFGMSECMSISLTNSQENRMRLKRQMGNDIALNLDDKWPDQIFGGNRNKTGPAGKLQEELEMFFLKFTSVTLDKANIAKEFLQSFCDLSFHLTAELSLQLRNFKVLLIPIKVIFCIIDVICALLHPIRLVFAIIRLFLCLFDLILLLPQLSVPAMFLALLLHLLELLLCVILKILSIINAINEIITALVNAIEQKNYPAIVALEEAINEHLFSLEADLSVLEPIITILKLFLELLMLVFSFPCQIGADDDEEACIDPSQLAGLILGKVAPRGRIEPDALLPLAQTYTTLPVDNVKTWGNTPPDLLDGDVDGDDWCDDPAGICPSDILIDSSDELGTAVVSSNSGYAGNELPGLTDSATGDNLLVIEGGFFEGDSEGSGEMPNIDYPGLKFDDSDFNATFGLSFTRSVKKFAIFTGPDPRIVEFQFNDRGKTSIVSWWPFFLLFPLFFRKKTISELQTLDSPPMFLRSTDDSLHVCGGSSGEGEDGSDFDFISPIDGKTGIFLTKSGDGYQPKPLTVEIELQEASVNEETMVAEFNPVTVTKTFGNIPMIALVDDEFNVYFVEETDTGGGIIVTESGEIESINAKMINHPSAPKKRFGKEDQEVYRNIDPKSTILSGDPGAAATASGVAEYPVDGELVIKAQANASFLSGLAPSGTEYLPKTKQGAALEAAWTAFEISGEPDTDAGEGFVEGYEISWTNSGDAATSTASSFLVMETVADDTLEVSWEDAHKMPFPELGWAYDFGGGHRKEQKDLGNSLDSIKVFDFPRLYIVDVRQVADDIASACGASGPMELLLDLPGFEEDLGDIAITPTLDCLQEFLQHFKSEELDDDGVPLGIIPKLRHELAIGAVEDEDTGELKLALNPVPMPLIITKYDALKACVENSIDDTCRFVINPLNTTFKLLGDDDETPLTEYINPEQKDLATLIKSDIVDELDFDEMEGFPSITGAMEYASGVGDMIVAEAESKVLIELIPRDCYDEEISQALDLSDSIKIDFLTDDTGSARRIEVIAGEEDLVDKDESTYSLAVTADSPGKVVMRGTVCSVIIQAVTESGIIDTRGESEDASASSDVDCIEDAESTGDAEADSLLFAPGELMKVDRTLTILFVPKSGSDSGGGGASGKYGDDDRDESAKSAKPGPQTFGTKLEN